jgi:hypothetical protein
MKLTHITLSGVMVGSLWMPSVEGETEFNMDFAAPGAPHSPWQVDWQNIDEALQAALATGDFVGGMGDLVCGTLTFHMAGDGRSATISKPLEKLAAAKRYLAEEA